MPAGAHETVEGLRRVLVADDSRTFRRLLRLLLTRSGFEVVEAADGREALARLATDPVPLVISDWMMPGLTGPELCRAIRCAERDGTAHTYVILLTARHASEDLAEGLDAGADDFLPKPVNEIELLARLKAGQRIVAMQARIADGRRRIETAYAELKRLSDAIDRDLALASLLQAELVPPPVAQVNGTTVAVRCRQAGPIGGDLVGHFPIGDRGLGVYAIDVSGHGIAAALRAVHLAQLLNAGDPRANIAFAAGSAGQGAIRDPAATMAELNRRFPAATGHDLFFTMALAVLDLETGTGRLCRAGHPPPMALAADGAVRVLTGGGSPPVGLLPGIAFASDPFTLAPGERLLLYSDGLAESPLPDGGRLGTEGIARALAVLAGTPTGEVLDRLLADTAPDGVQEDDISAVLVEPGASGATGRATGRADQAA